ncbi:hypothetical protein [Kitasatospora atroaurantiaca]|nr:hypothetical protein [Kitasatospora atroaurantiaca]
MKQIARLERELERSPLTHSWAYQRWTPARVKTLIGGDLGNPDPQGEA